MNYNPYEVLGVSASATDEEIKHAYHELARKYHPDNCPTDALRDLAAEKMKEINRAYDTIKEWRQSGYRGETKRNQGEPYLSIRRLLNENRTSEADRLLESIPYNQRGAEWLFLKGVLYMRLGRFVDATSMLESACREDPTNSEYRDALNNLRQASANMRQAGQYQSTATRSSNGGCSNCDICSTLICADCCCECMGGDLISCC